MNKPTLPGCMSSAHLLSRAVGPPKLLRNRKAVIYVWIVMIIGVIAIAFAYFTVHYILIQVEGPAEAVAQGIGSNSTTYVQVTTFIDYLDEGLLLFCLVVLGLWGYQYSQKRGEQV